MALVDNIITLAQTVGADIKALESGKVAVVPGKQLSTEDYTTSEKSKVASVNASATVNATDALLRDRTTHTGVQSIATVGQLQATLDHIQITLALGV